MFVASAIHKIELNNNAKTEYAVGMFRRNSAARNRSPSLHKVYVMKGDRL
jgi:hypothetical protein